MKRPITFLLIAAALCAGLGTAATAQTGAVTLQPVRLYDNSANARAVVAQDLALLGVRIDRGDPLTLSEYFAVQRIINDQSTLTSKKNRIQNIVDTGSPNGFLRLRFQSH